MATDAVAGQRAGGRVASARSRLEALREGYEVYRGPESLASVVADIGEGVSAETAAQAAAASIVVIAVPWDRVSSAVQGLDWNRRIVIDATNDWAADDLGGRASSELVADLVAGARVVKAANTLGADVLGSDREGGSGGRRVIFLSGDDNAAKAEVSTLFEEAGFAPIDLGSLAGGGLLQQIHRPLAGVNLIQLTRAPR